MKATSFVIKVAFVAALLALACFGRLPEAEENLAFVLAGMGLTWVLKR